MEGNTCYPELELITAAATMLDVPEELIKDGLKILETEKSLNPSIARIHLSFTRKAKSYLEEINAFDSNNSIDHLGQKVGSGLVPF